MGPFMCTPLLKVTVSTYRDVVRVRQLTRRAAALLSFETIDQICLAAAAFDLAWQAFHPAGRASVSFLVDENMFRVVCKHESLGDGPHLLLEKSLPPPACGVLLTDLAWTLEQVTALGPLDLFEELQTANRELLRTLLELAALRTKGSDAAPALKEPDAA
jgi:hypothetical protein